VEVALGRAVKCRSDDVTRKRDVSCVAGHWVLPLSVLLGLEVLTSLDVVVRVVEDLLNARWHGDGRGGVVANHVDVRETGMVSEIALCLGENFVLRWCNVLVGDGHHRLARASAVVVHTVRRTDVSRPFGT